VTGRKIESPATAHQPAAPAAISGRLRSTAKAISRKPHPKNHPLWVIPLVVKKSALPAAPAAISGHLRSTAKAISRKPHPKNHPLWVIPLVVKKSARRLVTP